MNTINNINAYKQLKKSKLSEKYIGSGFVINIESLSGENTLAKITLPAEFLGEVQGALENAILKALELSAVTLKMELNQIEDAIK